MSTTHCHLGNLWGCQPRRSIIRLPADWLSNAGPQGPMTTGSRREFGSFLCSFASLSRFSRASATQHRPGGNVPVSRVAALHYCVRGPVGSGVNSLTLGPYDCLGRLASAGQRPAVHNTRLPLPPSASVEMEVKARTRCLLGRVINVLSGGCVGNLQSHHVRIGPAGGGNLG
jgi:hypothetical protein